LLDGLLSRSALEDTEEAFPGLPKRGVVYELFQQLRRQRWDHAEQFLDFADLAVDPRSPNHKILKRLLSSCKYDGADTVTPERFRDLATLSIAAEVSTYTARVDLRAEAWAPYVRWAAGRRGNDSVLTFNYDTVIERLGQSKNPKVTNLGDGTVFRPFGDNAFGEDKCIIHKLHGSADWAWAEQPARHQQFKVFPTVGSFTLDDAYRPLIAMPGATKKRLCSEHLDGIWGAAMRRLREAEVIVFLGYRFPPSDSFSRTALLGAIQQNQSQYLRIHTVLGPNVAHETSARLGALLRATLEGAGRAHYGVVTHRPSAAQGSRLYDVLQQPLYVEDFLSVLNLDMLFGKRSEAGPTAWG